MIKKPRPDDGYEVLFYVDGNLIERIEGMVPTQFMKKLARRKGIEIVVRKKED